MTSSLPTLTSPSGRIRLIRPIDDTWDKPVSELRVHPKIRQYLRYLPETLTLDDVKRRRESRMADKTIWDYLIIMDTETLAGMVGVFDIKLDSMHSATCECGILVNPDILRGGIATEGIYTLLNYVFGDRNFHRVTFITNQDNEPMRNWLERTAGATLEGISRDIWQDGPERYSSAAQYSILKPEWDGGIKEKIGSKIKRSF